jgi:EAL and modified HD-GYP domain-containing signal transduction protein
MPCTLLPSLLHRLPLPWVCEEADQEAIIEYAAACGLDANEVNTDQVKALVWAE